MTTVLSSGAVIDSATVWSGRPWPLRPDQRWIEAYERQAEHFVLTARATGAAEFRPALFPGLVVPLGELWLPSGSRER